MRGINRNDKPYRWQLGDCRMLPVFDWSHLPILTVVVVIPNTPLFLPGE